MADGPMIFIRQQPWQPQTAHAAIPIDFVAESHIPAASQQVIVQ
jgi:hypothetical protein